MALLVDSSWLRAGSLGVIHSIRGVTLPSSDSPLGQWLVVSGWWPSIPGSNSKRSGTSVE